MYSSWMVPFCGVRVGYEFRFDSHDLAGWVVLVISWIDTLTTIIHADCYILFSD